MAVSASADIASALWYCGPGQVEIRQEVIAPPGAGEVRVKTLYSAISRGTESLVFGGRIPVSEFERMRAPFMAGDFPFPVKYGYAAVGRIENGSDRLARQDRLCAPPAPDRVQHPCERRGGASGGRAATARGAGGQHGNRAQRRVGRGTGTGRPHRRCRSRRGRFPRRLSVRADFRCRRHARRHQLQPSGISRKRSGLVSQSPETQRPIAISSFTPAARPMGCERRSNWPETKRRCWK